jgi:prevent-host-death family protein
MSEARWHLGDAKQQFSRLVQQALDQGPQIVTRRGEDAVVVLSVREYRRIQAEKPGRKAVLAMAPLDLDLDAPRDLARNVEL